jgi:hypothetical protein
MRNKYKDDMKDLLNKLIPKLPEKQARYIVAEANDLDKWTGCHFYIDEETWTVYYKQVPKNHFINKRKND